MYFYSQNKKLRDPRYFLKEDDENEVEPQTTETPKAGGSPTQTPPTGSKEPQIGLSNFFGTTSGIGAPDAGNLGYEPGSPNTTVEPGVGGMIQRARSVIGKNWDYDHGNKGYGGPRQGGPEDPKPDPKQIPMGSSGAKCDCTGFVAWAGGLFQKRGPLVNQFTPNLGPPSSTPQVGDIAYRGPPSGKGSGHVGIVTVVNPPGATTEQINNGQADFNVIHCTSRRPSGGAVVEDQNAIKSGWAGRGKLNEGRAPVMFFKPSVILNSGILKSGAVAESKGVNIMRHNTWDKMMYHLLSEQAEKRRIAEKAFAGKKELDNDEDGVPKWADKNDKDPKVGSKGKKSKGKKGKVPPQLKMHIQKKKKSKLDEEIERLEKILFEELTDAVHGDVDPLKEYGEDKYPSMEEEDDDDFDADELPEYGKEDFGDYGEESMKKFAQKSKAFADKYTEEDEYEEAEETCPECGSELTYAFDGQHCDECGYEQSDEDDMDDDLEDDDLDDEDDDLDDEDEELDELRIDDPMDEGIEEYLTEAEVKKKQPRLGKVTRNPAGSKKKFHVYVKCGGRVKKISFGDPGLSIKRDSPARRKNFRARHKCDKPAGKDRCTARYWSCYQWRAGKKVEGEE